MKNKIPYKPKAFWMSVLQAENTRQKLSDKLFE